MGIYEFYIVNDDAKGSMYAANWSAQTFTPSTAHSIEFVKLLIYREGLPGNFIVSIRATTDSKPSGGDLASVTINGNDLSDNAAGSWETITFDAPTDLNAGTMYAIVCRAPDGSGVTSVEWRRDGSSATYEGGDRCTSLSSGVGWSVRSGEDYLFEEWGTGLSSGAILGGGWWQLHRRRKR